MYSSDLQTNTMGIVMSSSLPAGTSLQSWCSVSYPTVKVFVMLSWQPRLMHPKPITLDLVSTLPRVLLRMPTPSATIASSRSLPIRSSPKLNDAESLTSSSWMETSMPLILRQLTYVWAPLNGLCSGRRKVVSRCIHCMIWKHRSQHSFT